MKTDRVCLYLLIDRLNMWNKILSIVEEESPGATTSIKQLKRKITETKALILEKITQDEIYEKLKKMNI